MLDRAFGELGLSEIVSFTTERNLRSRRVMERIGMTRDLAGDFEHPLVPEAHPLRPRALYGSKRGAVGAERATGGHERTGDGMETTTGLVIFCKDVARVSAFYRATLDLRTVENERSHQLLAGRGVELVVHAVPRAVAARILIEVPPVVREGAAFKPAFSVGDLEAVRAAATATGGGLGPADRAWRIRGFLVLDGFDPEGNVVQFKQAEGGASALCPA